MNAAATSLYLPDGSMLPLTSAPRRAATRREGWTPSTRARFDAAVTNDDNRKHWGAASGLSADAEANPYERKILRDRARYEIANNCYAKGMIHTLAHDIIGTGPRLQMLSSNDALNREIEEGWERWSEAVGLPEKLMLMRVDRAQSGENFAIIANNPGINCEIKLDITPIEADMVCSDLLSNFTSEDEVDGIRYDKYGNPVEYRVLRRHPGEISMFKFRDDDFRRINARDMIHYFRQERPGQHRGIPEITPALPLFALLRRFTLAVLAAAETAAEISGVIYTDTPADAEPAEVEPLDTVEITRKMLMTMPEGWKIMQMKAEQPVTTYGDFKREILNEAARCIHMPFNIAAGNSSSYNYASGRLDHQTYHKNIRVDQHFTEHVVVNRILHAWLQEFAILRGFGIRSIPPHAWFWDGSEHVDPKKEADAQDIKLKNHSTNHSIEYARQGRDWETERLQLHKEQLLELKCEIELAAEREKLMKKFKLTGNQQKDDTNA